MINFNEAPFLGTELECIKDAIARKHICGDGEYTKRCNALLEKRTGAAKALLTNSGTAALEMAALLCDIKAGDEVIVPSYTFVTTVSAFVLRGAVPVFADIRPDTLNMDETKIESAITPKTKAIVPVHYAGVCAEMDAIKSIADKHNLIVVEDAAQAVGSRYKGRAAGTIGRFGCYSFHETKNVSAGEGGAILINASADVEQAEIVREKGTNRSKFFRGYVDKYTWVALGSSYLPSDMIAAYLWPQLERADEINARRMKLWNRYYDAFAALENKGVRRPFIPAGCEHNAHMFYMLCPDLDSRTRFIEFMKEKGVQCVFHYIPLHSAPAGRQYGRAVGDMSVTDRVGDTLVRLPLFYGLDEKTQDYIIENVLNFWGME